MRNYFNVTQRHIGKRAVYNYTASRRHRSGVKNRKRVLKNTGLPINTRGGSMIKNTKMNANWGKVAIGVRTIN